MKIIYKLDDEIDGPDAIARMAKCRDMAFCLYDIQKMLMVLVNDEPRSIESQSTEDYINDGFYEILDEYGIDIDEILS